MACKALLCQKNARKLKKSKYILKKTGFLAYLAIIIAIIVARVMTKSRVGLQLRAVGENPATADAAGIKVERYKYIATCTGSAGYSLLNQLLIQTPCSFRSDSSQPESLSQEFFRIALDSSLFERFQHM